MEILENFGFNIQLFLAQIVNFLILAFLFKKFLYKPILTMIQNRQNTINKGLKDAQHAEVALEKANAEREKILSEASSEAKKILSETKSSAEATREEILSRTRQDAEKIMHDARAQAELEIERIRGEGERIAVGLTASLLEKTLSGAIDKNTQKKIIDKTLNDIKKYEN